MRRCRWVLASALVAVVGVSAARAQSPAACDRACLKTMLDQYLNAVIAHDPSKAPLLLGFRQTENAINVRPGQVKKINIAIPDFTLVGGTDPQNWANRLPGITTVDLNFTSLFSVVSGTPPLPPGAPRWCGPGSRNSPRRERCRLCKDSSR